MDVRGTDARRAELEEIWRSAPGLATGLGAEERALLDTVGELLARGPDAAQLDRIATDLVAIWTSLERSSAALAAELEAGL